MTEIYSGVIAYTKGYFYRRGNRIYCSDPRLPAGIVTLEGTYELVPDAFQDFVGDPMEAHSWQVKGWNKHSAPNSAKAYHGKSSKRAKDF